MKQMLYQAVDPDLFRNQDEGVQVTLDFWYDEDSEDTMVLLVVKVKRQGQFDVTLTRGLPSGMTWRDYIDVAIEVYKMLLAAHPGAEDQKRTEQAHTHLVARAADPIVQSAVAYLDGPLAQEV